MSPRVTTSHRHTLSSALALAILVPALSGCGVSGLIKSRPDHDRGASASAKSSKEAAREVDRLAEARERAAADSLEPYWPYRVAELHAEAHAWNEAEAALRQALKRDPRHAPSLALLSKLYFDQGRHQPAVELLEPVRTHPEAYAPAARAELLLGLALHYQVLGETDQARATMAQVSDGGRHGNAVLTYLKLQGDRPDSATAPAKAAIDDDDKSAVNQNNYGITRLRAGDPTAARRAFLKAIERDPALPGPYYNLAILDKYYLLDDDAAARWFDAYWQRAQDDPDSLFGVFRGQPRAPVAGKGDTDR